MTPPATPIARRSSPPRRFVVLLLFLAIPLAAYFLTQYRLAYLAQQQRIAAWEQEQALEQKLDTLVEIQFDHKVKLKTWLAAWNEQTGLSAQTFDNGRFDETPGDEFELWLNLPPLPARDALHTLCEMHWGHWSPQPDGRIAISLERYHRSQDLPLEMRLYALPPHLAEVSPDQLISIIQTCVERDSWADVGGRGQLEYANGHLAVVQHHDLQRRITGFLQPLEQAVAATAGEISPSVIAGDEVLRPRPLTRDPQHMDRLLNLLEQPVSLDVVEMPLDEFASHLSKVIHYPVVIDHEHLMFLRDLRGDKITCQVHDMKLRHALALALSPLHLCITPFANGRAIQLTSSERAWDHRVFMAYYVGDFVRFEYGLDVDPIIDTVFSTIPDLQHRIGPSEGESFENLLIHPVTLEKHFEIQDLLMTLRRVRSGAYGAERMVSFDNESSQRMLQRYEQPLELSYDEQTIRDIVRDIRQRSGLPIYVFDQYLEAQGIRPDQRISCHLPARPLRENLAAMLHSLGLAVELHPQYLTVGPAHVADLQAYPMHVIDLRSLVRRWPDFEHVLRQLLPSASGGTPATFGDLLVVDHQDVGRVRAADLVQCVLHIVRTGEPYWPGVGRIDPSQWHRPLDRCDLDAINRHRIGELLSQRISLQETERPMGEILFALAREHHLPIATPVIPEGGVTLETVISVDGKNQPLSEILQNLLGDSNIARWQVRHGALCVEHVALTEAVRSEGLRLVKSKNDYYQSRWYFVGDLLQPRGLLTAEDLCDELRFVDAAKPDPNGKIQFLVEPQVHLDALLVIQGTPEQHVQVEQILQDLRQPALQQPQREATP